MSAMAIASRSDSPSRDSAHAAVKNTRLRGASDKLKESLGLEWEVFPSVGSLNDSEIVARTNQSG